MQRSDVKTNIWTHDHILYRSDPDPDRDDLFVHSDQSHSKTFQTSLTVIAPKDKETQLMLLMTHQPQVNSSNSNGINSLGRHCWNLQS